VPLINNYDIYQHLMTYWAEVMQDDVYILAQDGWDAGRVIRDLAKNAEGKLTETPDITLGRRKLKAELIPPALIVARFFADEQAKLDALGAVAEETTRAVDEIDEEHGGDDGLLADGKTDAGKLTAKSVKDRIRAIRGGADVADEQAMLTRALGLIDDSATAAKAVKAAQAVLDGAVVKHYATLDEDAVKLLLVGDKWLARVQGDVVAEVDRVSQALAGPDRTLRRAAAGTGRGC
jgi:type I restriction enzyme M protein